MSSSLSTGIVTGRKVSDNRDGGHKRLLLTVSLSSAADEQTVEWMGGAGDDASPVDGARVVVLAIGQAWKVAFAADDQVDPTSAEGERKIYAIDGVGGAIVSAVHVKADGSAVITTGAGDTTHNADGSVDYANGASLTSDGDYISATNVSLNNHKHIGNLGNPTGPALPG